MPSSANIDLGAVVALPTGHPVGDGILAEAQPSGLQHARAFERSSSSGP